MHNSTDLMTDWLLMYNLALLGIKLDLDIYSLHKYNELFTDKLLDRIELEQIFAYGRTYKVF